MAARGPQNGRRGLERGLPLGFWRSRQLSLNKFLDPSNPSMRKVDNGEKIKKREKKIKIMSFLVATDIIASWPPERRKTGTPHARAN